MQAPELDLSMIVEGYRLPFQAYPSHCFLNNNRSALNNTDFVKEAILEFLHNNCVMEYNYYCPPFCVIPLLVWKGRGSKFVCTMALLWKHNGFHAHFLSQFADKDDWSVHQSVFKLLNEMWGPFTIDHFASYYNYK